MATMNVSLPDEMKVWVEERARAGDYAGASDLIRDLIRRRQARERGLARLQELVDEALASGEPRTFDREELFREVTRREMPGARRA
jgi:antitoxin ParD1/3/4